MESAIRRYIIGSRRGWQTPLSMAHPAAADSRLEITSFQFPILLACLLALLFAGSSTRAATITLAWDPNFEPDIAGYRLHYGTPVGNFTSVVDVGLSTIAAAPDLVAGLSYAFYVTCYNLSGLESEPSNLVEYTVPPDPDPPTNQPPQALSAEILVASGIQIAVPLAGSDPDGDPIGFRILSSPSPGSLEGYPVMINPTNASILYRSIPGFVGTEELKFETTDGLLDSTAASITIRVEPATSPLPIDAGPDLEITLPGKAILRGSIAGLYVIDPDPTLQVNWFPVAEVSPKILETANPLVAHARFTETGPHVLFLAAGVDGQVGFDTTRISVRTLPDQPRFTLHREAELGTLTGSMTVGAEAPSTPGSSPTRWITATNAANGSASYQVDLAESADYFLWCRVQAPSPSSDSFVFMIDDDPSTRDIYDAAEEVYSDEWEWTLLCGRGGTNRDYTSAYTINPRVFRLEAGTHKLTFETLEANTRLDRFFLTSDPEFNPVWAETTQTPPTLRIRQVTTGSLEIEFDTVPGRLYQIVNATGLPADEWSPLTLPFQADSTSKRLSLAPPASDFARFLRVVLLPHP